MSRLAPKCGANQHEIDNARLIDFLFGTICYNLDITPDTIPLHRQPYFLCNDDRNGFLSWPQPKLDGMTPRANRNRYRCTVLDFEGSLPIHAYFHSRVYQKPLVFASDHQIALVSLNSVALIVVVLRARVPARPTIKIARIILCFAVVTAPHFIHIPFQI